MELKVKFYSDGNWAAELAKSKFSLLKVKQIRKDLGVNFLNLNVINNYIEGYKKDIEFNVSEEQANESKQFDLTDFVKIKIKSHGLNSFIKEVIKHTVNQETGAITKAWIEYEADNDEIFKWWKENGFSLTIE